MTSADPRRWIVLLDFDGTVTERDADHLLADRALGPDAPALYGPLARAYEALELDVRAYYAAWFDLLPADPARLAALAATIPLRPDCAPFLRWCRTAGLVVRLVSEGLDLYIAPMLRAAGLTDLDVSCNRATRTAEGWRVEPPPDGEPCARCLNCKGGHVRRARAAGFRVAVVGNGASDLCAARLADRVVARDSLVDHCRREGIAYEPWASFDDVRAALESA